MSKVYTAVPPEGAPRWCPVLTQSITACMKELTNELRDTLRETNSGVQNIDAKFDRLSQRILAEVESATTIAKESLTIANEAKQEVLSINRKCTDLEKENNGLEQDYVRLQKQQNSQESHSKRDNLLIHGINEEEHDDDDDDDEELLCATFRYE